jgi:hypothetical protein
MSYMESILNSASTKCSMLVCTPYLLMRFSREAAVQKSFVFNTEHSVRI